MVSDFWCESNFSLASLDKINSAIILPEHISCEPSPGTAWVIHWGYCCRFFQVWSKTFSLRSDMHSCPERDPLNCCASKLWSTNTLLDVKRGAFFFPHCTSALAWARLSMSMSCLWLDSARHVIVDLWFDQILIDKISQASHICNA